MEKDLWKAADGDPLFLLSVRLLRRLDLLTCVLFSLSVLLRLLLLSLVEPVELIELRGLR